MGRVRTGLSALPQADDGAAKPSLVACVNRLASLVARHGTTADRLCLERLKKSAVVQSEDEATETLELHQAGAELRSSRGYTIRLHLRAAARRIVRALMKSSRDQPARCLTTHELFAIGWPEANVSVTDASARVYQVIRFLRKSGLADALLRSDDGYFIAPTVKTIVHA